jgi:hypothetical protein
MVYRTDPVSNPCISSPTSKGTSVTAVGKGKVRRGNRSLGPGLIALGQIPALKHSCTFLECINGNIPRGSWGPSTKIKMHKSKQSENLPYRYLPLSAHTLHLIYYRFFTIYYKIEMLISTE